MFAEMEQAALAELMQEQFPREQLADAAQRRHALSRPVLRGQRAGRGAAKRTTILPTLAERFHDAHQRRYGHMAQSEAVEIVNFQVTAVGTIPKPQVSRNLPPQERRPKPHETRTAYFGPSEENKVPVFSPLSASARRA